MPNLKKSDTIGSIFDKYRGINTVTQLKQILEKINPSNSPSKSPYKDSKKKS